MLYLRGLRQGAGVLSVLAAIFGADDACSQNIGFEPWFVAIPAIDRGLEPLRRDRAVEETREVVLAYVAYASDPQDEPKRYGVQRLLAEFTGQVLDPESPHFVRAVTLPHTPESMLPAAMELILYMKPAARRGDRTIALHRAFERIRWGGLRENLFLLFALYDMRERLQAAVVADLEHTVSSLLPYLSSAELFAVSLFFPESSGVFRNAGEEFDRRQGRDRGEKELPSVGDANTLDAIVGVPIGIYRSLYHMVGGYFPESPIDHDGIVYCIVRGTSRLALGSILSAIQLLSQRALPAVTGAITRGAFGEADGQVVGADLLFTALTLRGVESVAHRARTGMLRYRYVGETYEYKPLTVVERLALLRERLGGPIRKDLVDVLAFFEETVAHERRVNGVLRFFGARRRHIDMEGPFGKGVHDRAKLMASRLTFDEMTATQREGVLSHRKNTPHHQTPHTPWDALESIADQFDALLNRRVYKDPFPFSKAVEIIRGQFKNPALENRALSVLKKFYSGEKTAALAEWRSWLEEPQFRTVPAHQAGWQALPEGWGGHFPIGLLPSHEPVAPFPILFVPPQGGGSGQLVPSFSSP